MSSFLWTNSAPCQALVSTGVKFLLSHLKTRVVDKAEPPNCNMFISCGAQQCLYSCWGFLPHLVITRRQRAASPLLEDSKMWLKEVWRQRDEGPLRATRMALHHMRGVRKLLIAASLRHKLHNNFAVAGVVMNALRVYASNFAGKKNADNHDELKHEK